MVSTAAFSRAATIAGQVEKERSELDPVKVLLTLAMVLPFVVGWVIGAVFKALWIVVSWVYTAGKVGFKSAMGDQGGG